MACNAYRWKDNPEKWKNLSKVVSEEQVDIAFEFAVKNMARLNLIGK